MFLMGPLAQFKKMFEKGRIIATCLYFGAMFITLWMAIKVCTACMVVYLDPFAHSSTDTIHSVVTILHVYDILSLCTLPCDASAEGLYMDMVHSLYAKCVNRCSTVWYTILVRQSSTSQTLVQADLEAGLQLHSFPGTILALLVQMGALIW